MLYIKVFEQVFSSVLISSVYLLKGNIVLFLYFSVLKKRVSIRSSDNILLIGLKSSACGVSYKTRFIRPIRVNETIIVIIHRLSRQRIIAAVSSTISDIE